MRDQSSLKPSDPSESLSPPGAVPLGRSCTKTPFRTALARVREIGMAGFTECIQQGRTMLLPVQSEGGNGGARAADLLVDEFVAQALGVMRTAVKKARRPDHLPQVPLKLFIHGHLNRTPTSRRPERAAVCDAELMRPPGRPAPNPEPSPLSGAGSKDRELIRAANAPENGPAIRRTCARLVAPRRDPCRRIGMPKRATVAIDGSKSKAVNIHARSSIGGESASRPAHLETGVGRHAGMILPRHSHCGIALTLAAGAEAADRGETVAKAAGTPTVPPPPASPKRFHAPSASGCKGRRQFAPSAQFGVNARGLSYGTQAVSFNLWGSLVISVRNNIGWFSRKHSH